jgi:hypothetical protein
LPAQPKGSRKQHRVNVKTAAPGSAPSPPIPKKWLRIEHAWPFTRSFPINIQQREHINLTRSSRSINYEASALAMLALVPLRFLCASSMRGSRTNTTKLHMSATWGNTLHTRASQSRAPSKDTCRIISVVDDDDVEDDACAK